MEKNRISPTDIIMPLLAAVLALGTAFVFHACPAHDDGSFMSCHWAQQTVFGLGCVMLVISFTHLGANSPRMKMGISLALLPVEIFTALVPNIVIKLCMSNTMRCHSIMRPSVVVLSLLMMIVTCADIFLCRKKEDAKNEN